MSNLEITGSLLEVPPAREVSKSKSPFVSPLETLAVERRQRASLQINRPIRLKNSPVIKSNCSLSNKLSSSEISISKQTTEQDNKNQVNFHLKD
jgi:hypothetical protein